jgi:hypothetical protein
MPTDLPGVMKEFAGGQLHSGSKTGPVVTNPKQAAAIGYSEQKKLAGGAFAKGPRAPRAPRAPKMPMLGGGR